MAKTPSLVKKHFNPFTESFTEIVVLPDVALPNEPATVALRVGSRSSAKRGCRFGGPALLPRDATWPHGPDGPLSLIGQLDFAELAAVHDGRLSIPTSGVLSFFYDVEKQPWGIFPNDAARWRFVYVEDPDEAVLHEPEDDDPTPGYSLEATIGAPVRGTPHHKVGGVGDWVQGDPRVPVAMIAEGGVECDPKAVRKAEADGVDVAALARHGASWRLLWQIDSDDLLFFTWGDVGRLYVFVKDTDLEQLNFNRAWVQLQCT